VKNRSDARFQLFRLKGFDDVIIGPRPQTFQSALQLAPGGEKDEGDARPRQCADPPLKLEPIHLFHQDIRDDQVGRGVNHHLERLGAAFRRRNVITHTTKELFDREKQLRLIVH